MASHLKVFYQIQASDKSTKLGVAILQDFGVTPDRNWFWIGAAALLGLAVVFNILFTLALAYLAGKFSMAFRENNNIYHASLNNLYVARWVWIKRSPHIVETARAGTG